MQRKSWGLWLGLALAFTARAQEPDPVDAAAAAAQFLAGLHFTGGETKVHEAGATLKLGEQFKYLGASEAQKVLEEFWGNPPDPSVLGMVVPAAVSLADAHAWAVVLTYNDDGHITDEEANEIDYAALLSEMQQGTAAENEARQAQGYPPIELVGWAAPPRYDAAQKKLHWAKELRFGGAAETTLNYDIRVLGREGYLSMNAVASIGDLATVQDGMQRLLQLTEFDSGHRYADFDEGTDKLAGYGLAALIGGAVAAKSGLFAKLAALLIAGKKLILPIIVGIGALFARLFKRKKDAPA